MMNRIFRPQLNARAKGNTIAEYVLIGALLVGASIFVMIIFSQNFNDLLAGLKTNMKSNTDQAASMEVEMQANAAMASMGGSASIGGNGNGTNLAQTTGANGNQGNIANSGKGLGGNAGGALNEQQASLVVEVSNKAHQVAELQKMLETIAKYSAGDIEKFKATSIYYNGQMYNVGKLAWALSNGQEISDLENTKNELLASGVSEEVKDNVSKLTNDVKNNASNSGNIANEVVATGANPTAVDNVTNPDDTHEDAADICEVAGKKDNGKACNKK